MTKVKSVLKRLKVVERPIIYVAGKYTGKNFEEIDGHIGLAEQASIKLIKKGWAVLTPHKNFAHYEAFEDGKKLTYKTWIGLDIMLLLRCDATFILNNWVNSKGTKGELEVAKAMGMDIFFEDDGYPTPIKYTSVTLQLDIGLIHQMMTAAHSENITLNTLVQRMLMKYISKYNNQDKEKQHG